MTQYLVTATGAYDQEGVVCRLNEILEFSHDNNIPSEFETKKYLLDGDTVTENILAETISVRFPGNFDSITGLSGEMVLQGISYAPPEGVIYNAPLRGGIKRVSTGMFSGGYRYLYVDGDGDTLHETVLTVNSIGEVLGVGFDYDSDGFLDPNKETTIGFTDLTDYGKRTMEDYGDVFKAEEPHYDTHDLIRDHEFLGHFRNKDPARLPSDAYFQVSDIAMNQGASNLIMAASSYMHNQFLERVGFEQQFEDIFWQVTGQVLSFLLASLAAPGYGTLVYIGSQILYNSVIGEMDAAEQRNILAYNSYTRVHSLKGTTIPDIIKELFQPSEVTLSMRHGIDYMTQNLISNPLTGSQQGVYTTIQKEIGRTTFKGEVILKPHGETGTGSGGETFEEYSWYDYTARNFMFLSKELATDEEWDIIYGMIAPIIYTDDPRYSYMVNSIPYLEDSIYSHTKYYDNPHDSIIFREMDGVPMLDFAQSTKGEVPDFYEDFPVLISSTAYRERGAEYFPLYLIFNGDTEYDLIPEGSVHNFRWDVETIQIWKPVFGGYTLHGTLESSESDFTIDYENNKLILHTTNVPTGYVLEVMALKYHDISDSIIAGVNYTSEELTRIASMQGVQADLLNYVYQYQIAVDTQALIDELHYTFWLTIVSTAITLGITYGLSRALLAWKGPAWAFDHGLIGTPFGMPTFAFVGIITEPFEEIFVDPALSGVVSTLAMPLNNDFITRLATNIVESGREGLHGIFDFSSHSENTKQKFSEFVEDAGYNPSTDHSEYELQQLFEDYKSTFSTDKTNIKKAGGFFSRSLSTFITFSTALSGALSGSLGFMAGFTGVTSAFKATKLMLNRDGASQQTEDMVRYKWRLARGRYIQLLAEDRLGVGAMVEDIESGISEQAQEIARIHQTRVSEQELRTHAKLLRTQGHKVHWKQLSATSTFYGYRTMEQLIHAERTFGLEWLLSKKVTHGRRTKSVSHQERIILGEGSEFERIRHKFEDFKIDDESSFPKELGLFINNLKSQLFKSGIITATSDQALSLGLGYKDPGTFNKMRRKTTDYILERSLNIWLQRIEKLFENAKVGQLTSVKKLDREFSSVKAMFEIFKDFNAHKLFQKKRRFVQGSEIKLIPRSNLIESLRFLFPRIKGLEGESYQIGDGDLGFLIFGLEDGVSNFLKAETGVARMTMSNLFAIDWKLQSLSVKNFEDRKIYIDGGTLKVFKEDIKQYIKFFVFSNEFSGYMEGYKRGRHYVKENPYGTELFSKEYDLIRSLWFLSADLTGDTKINGKTITLIDVQKILDITAARGILQGALTKGHFFAYRTLGQIRESVKNLLPTSIPPTVDFEIYNSIFKTLDAIKEYRRERNLHVASDFYHFLPPDYGYNPINLALLKDFIPDSLLEHIEVEDILGGYFPISVLKWMYDHKGQSQRASKFYDNGFTGVSTKHRKQLTQSLISYSLNQIDNGKIVSVDSTTTGLHRSIQLLLELSERSKYKESSLLSPVSKLPTHPAVLDNILRKTRDTIIKEMPIWRIHDNKLLTGHIDLVMIVDGIMYVCDYKPGDSADPQSSQWSKHFLNSIPQVSFYGKLMKSVFGIKEVRCITFSDTNAWIYDPDTVLEQVNDFLTHPSRGYSLLWEDYRNF